MGCCASACEPNPDIEGTQHMVSFQIKSTCIDNKGDRGKKGSSHRGKVYVNPPLNVCESLVFPQWQTRVPPMTNPNPPPGYYYQSVTIMSKTGTKHLDWKCWFTHWIRFSTSLRCPRAQKPAQLAPALQKSKVTHTWDVTQVMPSGLVLCLSLLSGGNLMQHLKWKFSNSWNPQQHASHLQLSTGKSSQMLSLSNQTRAQTEMITPGYTSAGQQQSPTNHIHTCLARMGLLGSGRRGAPCLGKHPSVKLRSQPWWIPGGKKEVRSGFAEKSRTAFWHDKTGLAHRVICWHTIWGFWRA